MRNPERIDKFLAEVGKVWKKYPDLRFGQLICNMQFTRDPFFIEEPEFLEILKKSYDFGKKETPND